MNDELIYIGCMVFLTAIAICVGIFFLNKFGYKKLNQKKSEK